MELTGFSPSRELGDNVDLSEEFAHHLTGIIAAAKLVELRHELSQRLFGLSDGVFRVVLALSLEAHMMLANFLAEEIREALARGPAKGAGPGKTVDVCQTTLRGHAAGAET